MFKLKELIRLKWLTKSKSQSPEKIKASPLDRLVPNCSVNYQEYIIETLQCQFKIVEILFNYANLC